MGATPNITFYDVLRLDPNDLDACSIAWCNIGKEVYSRTFYVEAICYFDKAIKLNPNNFEARNGRERAINSQKSFSDKLMMLNVGNHIDYINMLYSEAIKCPSRFCYKMPYLDEILKLEPEIFTVWYKKGELLENEGLYDDAISCYNKALELNPEFYERWKDTCFKLLEEKGIGLLFNNFYDEAITCFKEAIRLKPNEIRHFIEHKYHSVRDVVKEILVQVNERN